MKIVIDVFGADMPEEIVKGAITSVNLIDEVEIILTGDKDKIEKVIKEVGYTKLKLFTPQMLLIVMNHQQWQFVEKKKVHLLRLLTF